jgi:hypothetical protein
MTVFRRLPVRLGVILVASSVAHTDVAPARRHRPV